MATVRAFGRDPATRLDLVLATVDALLLLGVTVLLFWPSRGPTLGDRSARRVARLASRVQLVERRTASSLAWGDLPVGAALYEGDALYVPAGASASIAFTDGTRVEVEENSFLVLEPRRRAGTSLDRAPITIALRAGDLSASVSSTRNLGVEIETTDHSAQIEAGGSMRVASAGGRSEVEVIAGNALVRAGTQTERLGAHEGRELSAAGMHELAAGARLLEPAPNAHVVFAGDPPPIEFRWSVPAPTPTRVQIAQDSQFREILRDAELGAQSSIFIYSMPSAGRYFWRILVGEASSPGRRLTLSRLIAPRVLGPIGGEFVLVPAGAALTLLWSPVPFAERYRVELARDATFGAPLFDQQTQESRSAIVRDLPEGPYFWRVRAATGETSGDPNAPIEFYLVHRPRLEAPQLYEPEIEIAPPGPSRPVAPEPAAPSQPEKGAWLDRIWSLFVGTAWAQEPAPLPAGANRTAAATARAHLRWSPVGGAAVYELEIATDRAFRDVVARARVRSPAYEWDVPALRRYYWHVRSLDAENRAGPWSDPRDLAVAFTPPSLTAPARGARIAIGEAASRVTLRWSVSRLARHYLIEVAGDAGFSATQPVHVDGASFEFNPPATGAYRWRVRGVDVQGQQSDPSEAREFTVVVGAPAPLAPPPDASVSFGPAAAPTQLRWAPIGLAKGYRVQVATDAGFRQIVVNQTSSGPPVDFRPEAAGSYFWRVRVEDRDGQTGPWSAQRRIVTGLAPPLLATPADGATLPSRLEQMRIELSWSASPTAERYDLEIGSDPELQNVVARASPVETHASIELPNGARYFWRVRSVDRAGRRSPMSPARGFTLRREADLPAPIARAPADGQRIDFSSPSSPVDLSWSAVEGAASYELQTAPDEPMRVPQTRRLSVPRATIADLSAGVVYWRVRAADAQGASGAWSALYRFDLRRPVPARVRIEVTPSRLPPDGVARAEVRIALRDGQDRPIRDVRLVARATQGTVGDAREVGEGVYVTDFTAPRGRGGTVELSFVADGVALGSRARVELSGGPGVLRLGARVGYHSNLGAIGAPRGGLDLAVRLGFGGNLLVVAAADVYTASQHIADAGIAPSGAEASLVVVPMFAGLVYEIPLSFATPYAGLGVAYAWLRNSVTSSFMPETSQTGGAFGFATVLGIARALGPGQIFAEGGYAYAYFQDEPHIEDATLIVQTGGVTLAIGYRVSL